MGVGFQQQQFPCGVLYIAADEQVVRAVAFSGNWPRIKATLGAVEERSNPLVRLAIQQLQEYFAGQRRVFELPLQMDGTPFQRRVWLALQVIPYAETRSYSEQAAAVGQPDAVRAIGTANGLNPLSIVIPCHRVIAKSGKLAGYAGGFAAKRYLLALEKSFQFEHGYAFRLTAPC